MNSNQNRDESRQMQIAIIGMAARFPGARNLEDFWAQQERGLTAVSFFSDQEVAESGVSSARIGNPAYVKARGILEDIDLFDAAFFGFTPRQAEITDPQQRLFLESIHEALEDAGCDPDRYEGRIGVFAGSSMSSYLANLYSNPDLMKTIGGFQAQLANDKDFLATLVCYKLNLRGPGVTIQTACSTSLVSVHMACQSLLAGECEVALAGGVAISLPQKVGYLYQEGAVHSPDGYCRVFDARAQGTVGGNGLGIVVLKRLEEAIAEGDRIRAVIRGSAINNDGSSKVGFTAPGFAGQSQVLRAAYAVAEVEYDTVSYIEAHGTGTPLGDPLEIDALTKVFQEKTPRKKFCALGSAKANIGHLDAAAGVAGLIRATLALEHRRIPPCALFETPNPNINFDNSPFFVPTETLDWEAGRTPRRAGVSSFGIGGTNAHVVLEEAPSLTSSAPSRPWQAILISARTEAALESATDRLADHLSCNSGSFADIAYTLQTGRRAFGHRRIVAAPSAASAADALRQRDHRRLFTATCDSAEPHIAFVFPGGGAQYLGMARELYDSEPFFRRQMDLCFELLRPLLPFDLKQSLYAERSEAALASMMLPSRALPALFVIEYALACLWMRWGVIPHILLGHSLGEYVAACVAGAISLKDALELVAFRGRLIDEISDIGMLSVPLSEDEVRAKLGDNLSITAVNGPSLCVVAGPVSNLTSFEAALQLDGVTPTRLKLHGASHCNAIDPIRDRFAEFADSMPKRRPRIPYLSNVTGDWVGRAEIEDAQYWSKHLRGTVRFSECLTKLLSHPNLVLIEVGPGRSMGSLARVQPQKNPPRLIISSLPQAMDQSSDQEALMTALGRLWAVGVHIDWSAFYEGERQRKVELPTYPFERERYWIEMKWADEDAESSFIGRTHDAAQWFYAPSWMRSVVPMSPDSTGARWLVLTDEHGIGETIMQRFLESGGETIQVSCGEEFERVSEKRFRINPARPSDYKFLFEALDRDGLRPTRIAHFWSVSFDPPAESAGPALSRVLNRGYYSLMYLACAFARIWPDATCRIAVVSNNAQEVNGDDLLWPEKATVLGPCRVMAQEHPKLFCQSIDIDMPTSRGMGGEYIQQLACELLSESKETVIAHRGPHRWVQTSEPLALDVQAGQAKLRHQGVYLITGGLGRIGLVVAQYLAEKVKARLVLTTRRSWPLGPDARDAVIINQQLDAILAAGGKVCVVKADAGSFEEMRDAVTTARDRFGNLHGVIHAPAVGRERDFATMQETGPEETEWHFRAKVEGTYALAKAIEGADLDFCLLFSSLASLLGGLGFCAYASANIFQDAFAQFRRRRSSVPWVSVNWEGWRFNEADDFATAQHNDNSAYALNPVEGAQVFEYLLRLLALPQVMVSLADLRSRTRRATVGAPRLQPTRPGSVRSRARSQIFVPPANPTEQLIASIWEEHLGIAAVAAEDNFFELGGTSLLATYCMARLSEVLRQQVPLRSIFEAPTVRGLSQIILEGHAHKPDHNR
jgi:acyl transferase domain-containing protein